MNAITTLESCWLVRDTSRDHEDDFALRQLPAMRALASANEAIAKCAE